MRLSLFMLIAAAPLVTVASPNPFAKPPAPSKQAVEAAEASPPESRSEYVQVPSNSGPRPEQIQLEVRVIVADKALISLGDASTVIVRDGQTYRLGGHRYRVRVKQGEVHLYDPKGKGDLLWQGGPSGITEKQ